MTPPESTTDEPRLLYFWAPWCGPCRLLSPLVRALAQRLPNPDALVWIAVDDAPEQVRAFEVQNVPTLIVLAGKRVVARRAGALSPGQFHAFVEAAGLGDGI